MQQCRGITLWELIWVLALGAALSAAAAPGLLGFVLDARRTADINAFVTAIQLSRSEAAKRGRPAVLCKTTDGSICGGSEIDFDAGRLDVELVRSRVDAALGPYLGEGQRVAAINQSELYFAPGQPSIHRALCEARSCKVHKLLRILVHPVKPGDDSLGDLRPGVYFKRFSRTAMGVRRGPGAMRINFAVGLWIPAFAGMTTVFVLTGTTSWPGRPLLILP